MSAESSIPLNGMLPAMTTAANYAADKTIEFLQMKQEHLERQLLKQEIRNTNLYQSLIDSGVIPGGNLRTLANTVATTTSSNILDFLKNRNLLNGLKATSSNGGSSDSGGGVDAASTLSGGLNGLTSILPLGEAITSIGSVFEKLFGTKMWIYVILVTIIGIMLMIVTCFFMYCCCCNKFGKGLLCCCKFSGSSKKSKKKKQAIEDKSRLHCCL